MRHQRHLLREANHRPREVNIQTNQRHQRVPNRQKAQGHQRQDVNNEIEKLQMRERLMKAKARVRAYNNIEEDKCMEGD